MPPLITISKFDHARACYLERKKFFFSRNSKRLLIGECFRSEAWFAKSVGRSANSSQDFGRVTSCFPQSAKANFPWRNPGSPVRF